MGPAGAGLSEVVACLPGVEGHLPERLSTSWTGGSYAFSSERLALTAEEHERRSTALLGRLAAEPDALAGVFPGLPNAFTAIRCRVAGVALGWETWHSYPQTGELVHTASRLLRS